MRTHTLEAEAAAVTTYYLWCDADPFP